MSLVALFGTRCTLRRCTGGIGVVGDHQGAGGRRQSSSSNRHTVERINHSARDAAQASTTKDQRAMGQN